PATSGSPTSAGTTRARCARRKSPRGLGWTGMVFTLADPRRSAAWGASRFAGRPGNGAPSLLVAAFVVDHDEVFAELGRAEGDGPVVVEVAEFRIATDSSDDSGGAVD